jgi:hypothetical protein
MDWRYSQHDPALATLRERLKRLERIYRELVLRTDGEVERALEFLRQIGRRYGLFDASLTPEDFRRWLEERGQVQRDGRGQLELTPRGEQELRAGALETIFGALSGDARRSPRRPPGRSRVLSGRARSSSASRAPVDPTARRPACLMRRASSSWPEDLRERDRAALVLRHGAHDDVRTAWCSTARTASRPPSAWRWRWSTDPQELPQDALRVSCSARGHRVPTSIPTSGQPAPHEHQGRHQLAREILRKNARPTARS